MTLKKSLRKAVRKITGQPTKKKKPVTKKKPTTKKKTVKKKPITKKKAAKKTTKKVTKKKVVKKKTTKKKTAPKKKAAKRTTKKKTVKKKVTKKKTTKKKPTTKKKAAKKKPITKKKTTKKKTTKKKISKKKVIKKKTVKKKPATKKKVAKKKPVKKKGTKKKVTKKKAAPKKKTVKKKPEPKVVEKKPTKKKVVEEIQDKLGKAKITDKEWTPPKLKRLKPPKNGPLKDLRIDLTKTPWLPERSKIRAAIENGLNESYFNIRRLLYIGAAHGYTISHLYTQPVEIYAIEKSHSMIRHFLPLAENIPNVLPILGDASQPDSYAHYIPEKVDVVFQDIAQKDQVGIFMVNCNHFLSRQGIGMLTVKAGSIDSTAEPAAIFAETRARLEEEGATIVQEISLEPYQKHHRLFVVHLNPLWSY